MLHVRKFDKQLIDPRRALITQGFTATTPPHQKSADDRREVINAIRDGRTRVTNALSFGRHVVKYGSAPSDGVVFQTRAAEIACGSTGANAAAEPRTDRKRAPPAPEQGIKRGRPAAIAA